MSLGAISIGLGLLLMSTYVIASPWRSRPGSGSRETGRATAKPAEVTTPETLEIRRDASYAALADLDIDHELGKVNAEDYQRTRAALLTQAVVALQGLDRAQADLESEVESLVQARRKGLLTCGRCGGELGPDDKFCYHCGAAAQARCPKCNTRAGVDDRFCRACGAALG